MEESLRRLANLGRIRVSRASRKPLEKPDAGSGELPGSRIARRAQGATAAHEATGLWAEKRRALPTGPRPLAAHAGVDGPEKTSEAQGPHLEAEEAGADVRGRRDLERSERAESEVEELRLRLKRGRHGPEELDQQRRGEVLLPRGAKTSKAVGNLRFGEE